MYMYRVRTRVPRVTNRVIVWCRRTHLQRSVVAVDDPLEPALDGAIESSLLGLVSCDCSSFEHIIGVSVRETSAETRMVTLSVTANSRNRRPTMSPMNSSGINTAISETVSETMVNPIWPDL